MQALQSISTSQVYAQEGSEGGEGDNQGDTGDEENPKEFPIEEPKFEIGQRPPSSGDDDPFPDEPVEESSPDLSRGSLSLSSLLGGVKKAPIVISGDNVYIVWWNNNTGNDEVNFRTSADGGATFADKINLSNSTNSDSQDAEISAEEGNVVVTWWERNQTAEEPVLRISTDNGETFGPLLKLATNGTIGGAEG
jgi:hypothetical protein